MRDHTPLTADLVLPPELQHVEAFLQRHDADLRLRKSVETPRYYVLERRCRRAPAVNTGMRIASDLHLQARDGYIHVSTVHPNWLIRPWNMIRELVETGADLWQVGGSIKVTNEDEYEEVWQRESRRRRRRQLFQDAARDALPILDRLGAFGTKTRINNAGITAGEIPAKEKSL